MKLIGLYKEMIMGAIKGLDRIRFRGTLRWLANELGMRAFLSSKHVLLKDFKHWAQKFTSDLRQSCQTHAERKTGPKYCRRERGYDRSDLPVECCGAMHLSDGQGQQVHKAIGT